MKNLINRRVLLNCIVFCFLLQMAGVAGAQTVETYTINSNKLAESKNKIRNNDRAYINAEQQLINSAQKALNSGPYSVTYKTRKPESGSVHDYYSVSGYRWADKSKPKGAAYIKIDGKVNPERDELPDAKSLNNMANDVFTLGLAYYFTGDEKYAKKATDLLTVFFLDEDTKMNPNFEYSQTIPGVSGSGGATISSTALIPVVEGIKLIEGSHDWTKAKDNAMKKWFSDFLHWMTDSEKGRKESLAINNIGNYYVLQACVYALFVGNESEARSIFKNNVYKLIDEQITNDGEMPYELKRATPWNYVTFNFTALDELALVGQKLGIDIIDYVNPKGGSIKKSFDWLVPYARNNKKWNYGHDNVSSHMAMLVLDRIKSIDYSSITKNEHLPIKYNILLY